MADQQNPTTHDLNNILKYKNKYMGNSSNIINLFYNLPLSNMEISYELFPDKLTAQVNYKEKIENINKNKVVKALLYNSTAAFALIDNIEAINYNFTGLTYKVSRSDVEKWYGQNLSALLNTEDWKSKTQLKLEDNEYVNGFAKAVLKR